MKLLRSIIYLLILLLLSPCVLAAPGHRYVVVVHKDKQVDALSAKEIRRIFLGKSQRWPDGSVIVPVFNPNDEAHDQFSRLLLRKTPAQLSTYWRKNLYSGRSMMPYMAEDMSDLSTYLNRHKNAISYLSINALNDSLKRVRIIR